MGSLFSNRPGGGFFCAGTLIAPRIFMTAGGAADACRHVHPQLAVQSIVLHAQAAAAYCCRAGPAACGDASVEPRACSVEIHWGSAAPAAAQMTSCCIYVNSAAMTQRTVW